MGWLGNNCSFLARNLSRSTAIGALRSIHKQPDRVENYFGQKDVAYAA